MSLDMEEGYVGRRVRLRCDVDKYPHFVASAGLKGTVVDSSQDFISVMMDRHLPGAEEWDNCITWPETMPAELELLHPWRIPGIVVLAIAAVVAAWGVTHGGTVTGPIIYVLVVFGLIMVTD